MRDEPGVVDAAGYRLITDVRSRAAGKAVDVVFSQPYPAWKTLFSNLLPAHLLKDAPGSWTGALTNGLPASGGAFRVVSVDRARGEILLTRNDQYWDTPAVLDQLLLRRLGGTALVDGLGVGDVDIALPDPDDTLRTALGGLQPPPRIQTAPQPVVTELAFRTDGGPLADTRVRQAVEGLVDRNAVRAAVAPDALAADAFALAPSQDGYAGTAPTSRPDAASLLTSAGWTRDDDGQWRDAGEPVQLIIGAAAERPVDVEGRRERRSPAEVGRDRHHGRRSHRRGAVRPGDRPAHPAEHQRHPHALDVGHADAHPERRAHHRIGGDHHRRDHHRVTDPRARRGGHRRPRGPPAHRRRRRRHRPRVGLRLRRPGDPQRPAPAPVGAHHLLVGPAAAARTNCSPTRTAATRGRPVRPSRSCCGRRSRRCRCSSRSRCS